jgi:hypothetical protein
MAEPLLVPLGVEVSATTFAPKLAYPPASLTGSAKGHPAIQYTPEVLESIRALCAASFVQDGAGAPIVGLLYGTRTDSEMAISEWVPAGELRSHNDAEYALKLQMRLAAGRPETEGLSCLGWVRTRNHGEPRLVQEDQDLHDRCFEDFWQTVMIVRPSFQRPTKAAFYQREASGLFRFDRPVQEFFLYPAHTGDIEPPIAIPEPALAVPAVDAPPERARTLPTVEELELLPRGTFRAFSPWIAGLLVMVGLLAGAGIAGVRQARDARQQEYGTQDPLRVAAEAGRWAIRWNPRLADLDGASGALLSVTRDGHLKQITLPLGALRLGVTHVDWVSDDMEVALRVDRPGYPETEQRIRIVGPQRPPSR